MFPSPKSHSQSVIGLAVDTLKSVNCVGKPAQAVSQLKSAIGAGATTTGNVIESIQPFELVTTSVTL